MELRLQKVEVALQVLEVVQALLVAVLEALEASFELLLGLAVLVQLALEPREVRSLLGEGRVLMLHHLTLLRRLHAEPASEER